MKILRVFPSRTNATPNDHLCRFDVPGLFDPPECDEVHISVTFTWDIPHAQYLYQSWKMVHPVVKIGGPALDDPGGEFVPGRYLKPGFVITSRGCINRCPYCMAQKREGHIRELPIMEGWNIVDNNILATSKEHFLTVMEMLKRQHEKPIFTGGLEADLLTDWHAEQLRSTMPDRMFFANDRPGDIVKLKTAQEKLQKVGFTRSHLYAYVLIGYENDTIPEAENRLKETWNAGYMPFAMLYRDQEGKKRSDDWQRFGRIWQRPAITRCLMSPKSTPTPATASRLFP